MDLGVDREKAPQFAWSRKKPLGFLRESIKTKMRGSPLKFKCISVGTLSFAVGAGRMRQAARELVKAYIHGEESAALDDVFELLAWNQGIGFFSSEIGPSALFQAYKLIKNGEKQGKSREDICSVLREKFGEKNPEMQVLN